MISGGCLCGRIRYRASGSPDWVGHCHCRLCQRHSGAAFLTYVFFRDAGRVLWDGAKRIVYRSSPEVERGFCPKCGSSLSFARPGRGEMSVLAGTLDDPNAVAPSMHIFAESRCNWLMLGDGLPSHEGFPPYFADRDSRPR